MGAEPARERFFGACGRGGGPEPTTVVIPAGRFRMGSADGVGQTSERPAHEVVISRPFRMGVYAVTRAEWARFVGEEPPSGRLPVGEVSWYEARLYCARWGGRLPTEAEWEYVCRAGTETAYWAGDREEDLARVGWFDGNGDYRTHDGGELGRPNPWGLHDMHGNVWEWCQDWFGDYGPELTTDPLGPLRGTARVCRGGAYGYLAVNCRSSCRLPGSPAERFYATGFRLVLDAAPSQ